MSEAILYKLEDSIATITLNRPSKLNCLNPEQFEELSNLLASLGHDDAVRVVVITGAGKAFCSGLDVNELIAQVTEGDVKRHLELTRMAASLTRNIRFLDKPVIAAVNGMAAGGGAVLALAADLRIVSDTAQFAFLFTRIGLAGTDLGVAYLLPRVVGLGRALELLYLGDAIDAATAERYGLANRVVPRDELMATAHQMARRLAEGPALGLATTKQVVNSELSTDLNSALEIEARAQSLLLHGKDVKIFCEAFQKRAQPKFA